METAGTNGTFKVQIMACTDDEATAAAVSVYECLQVGEFWGE